MTMTPEVATLRISRDLKDLEASLNETLHLQAALFKTMISARIETGGNPFIGQQALLRLSKTQESLLDASNNLARVHEQLLTVQEDVTGADECPPEGPVEGSGAIEAA